MQLTASEAALAQQNMDYVAEMKRKVARGANKSDQILQRQLRSINEAIANSKQNVIKHILQSRSLEKSKEQVVDVHHALHDQLLDKLHPHIHFYRERLQDALTHNYSKPIENEVLVVIDKQLRWNYPKLLQTLMETLVQYSDEEFRAHLSTIPAKFLPISEALFLQIADLGSKGSLSALEAQELYAKTKDEHIEDTRFEWTRLQGRLCRKLLQLSLIKTALPIVLEVEEKLIAHKGFHFVVAKAGDKQVSANTSTTLPPVQSPRLLSPLSGPQHLSPRTAGVYSSEGDALRRGGLHTTSSSSSKLSLKSKTKQGKKPPSRHASASQPQPLNSKTLGSLDIPQLTSASGLMQELARSQAAQEQLRQRMVSDMAAFVMEHSNDLPLQKKALSPPKSRSNGSTINNSSKANGQTPALMLNSQSSGNLLLPSIDPASISSTTAPGLSRTTTATTPFQQSSQNALQTFIYHSAAQRIHTVLYAWQQRLLTRRLAHWRRVHQRLYLAHQCDSVTQYLASYRLFRLLEWSMWRRMQHRFAGWRQVTAFYEHHEQIAATIDIQRCFRGHLGRMRAQREATLRAAESIQQTFRIFAAKKMAQRLRVQTRRRKAARRIQGMWRKFKGHLVWKKARHYQKQVKCASLIQRVFRGHLYGRKLRRKLVRMRQRVRGALALQTLYRRYRACLYVEQVRRHQHRTRSAVLLQRTVRMIQQRRRYVQLRRRHLASLCITYAIWCYQARLVYHARVLYRAARHIQRLVRGFLGRRRYARINAVRLAWRQRRHDAIRVLTPLFLGHLTRRRLRTRLQDHLQRRQQAARILQRRLQARLYGQRARRYVQQMRIHLADDLRQRRAAREIQRMVRGRLLNPAKVQRQGLFMQEMQAARQRARDRLPHYYRAKFAYLSDQNLIYRKPVVRIQCLLRRKLARKKVHHVIRERSALVLQSFFVAQLQIKEAKAIVQARRQSLHIQRGHVVLIQRHVRGFVARRRVRRHRATLCLKWLCREVQVRRHIREAMDTFRYVSTASLCVCLCVSFRRGFITCGECIAQFE